MSNFDPVDGPPATPPESKEPAASAAPQFVVAGGKSRSPLRTALIVVGVFLGLALIGWLMRVASDGAKAEQAAPAAEAPRGNAAPAGAPVAVESTTTKLADGKRWTTVAAKGPVGRISVSFPAVANYRGLLPVTAEGTLVDRDILAGGTVSVMRLRSGVCPAAAPSDDAVDDVEVLGISLSAPGAFRAASSTRTFSDVGAYSVCAYLDPRTEGVAPLVAEGKLQLTDEGTSTGTPELADASYVAPGIYAASGSAIRGGAPGAKVEFEVRDTPGEEARKLAYLAFDGVKDPGCVRGERMPKQVYTDEDLGDVYDTINSLGLQSGISLSGGSAKAGEFRGQVYVTKGTCTSAATFTATRVDGARRELQKKLR